MTQNCIFIDLFAIQKINFKTKWRITKFYQNKSLKLKFCVFVQLTPQNSSAKKSHNPQIISISITVYCTHILSSQHSTKPIKD